MPEWNQGYFTDLNYSKNVFNELNPAYINFCLNLSGQSAADLDKPFAYAELGAGYGLSSAGLAALYPQGQFFCIDFNPSQTAWTQKLVNKAGLDNIKVYERSFRQMLDEDLPRLDYIALHGIYSWVTAEVREDIRKFIVKFLKPGGVVYLGYNSSPGWSAAAPMRDYLMALAANSGAADHKAVLNHGLNFLKSIQDAGGLYFKNVTNAGNWLDGWLKADPGYVFGELFCKEHRAFPFSEIVSDMAEAKTSYAGSLEITNYLDGVITPKPFMACLNQVAGNIVLRETTKNLLYNTAFRRDIFVKGTQALGQAKAEAALKEKILALKKLLPTLPEKVTIKNVELTLKPEVYNPVLTLLDNGPASVGQIAQETRLTISQVAQAAVVMMALDWVQPTTADYSLEKSAKIQQFNLALDETLESEALAFILSAYGHWHTLDAMSRLYVLAQIQGLEPESHIIETCRDRGWKMMRNGQEVSDPEQARQAVEEQSRAIAEQLPRLKNKLWGEIA